MAEVTNVVEVFRNEEFGEIRTLIEGDKVLFCASDVAKALGYANPRDSINRYCKVDGVVKRDGVSKTTNQHGVTTEQITELKFINEGNVYRLIAHSKLPSAEKFESWVFDEVLPTIRKTGSYSIERKPDSYMIDDPIQRHSAGLKRKPNANSSATKSRRTSRWSSLPTMFPTPVISSTSGLLPRLPEMSTLTWVELVCSTGFATTAT